MGNIFITLILAAAIYCGLMMVLAFHASFAYQDVLRAIWEYEPWDEIERLEDVAEKRKQRYNRFCWPKGMKL